ncbi:YlaC family protein [Erwiniaceae bacterium BAC15a-03b]|uniref:YlaC family protein n=1 Tax=Winslowiella arboricola TaxID=2978220 RepID=A0A9J6PTM8_9GAMM|nr:YlaC family protein [Winslowiella arboricola]MCU5774498.1 YlaC family protein [Winslowiella arboricola]MCU5778092.1 YlaC family protein [Winslowiella arboricola]
MNEIKQILQREIDVLNREEQRDNKPRFSFNFLKTHPGLWLSMYICYALTVVLIFTTDFLGWPAFWGATVFILVMSVLMLLDINPKYRFEDIDHLHDLRVCYYGEWYYVRTLSDDAISEILNHHATPENVKAGINQLLSKKGEVDFYDVYSLTWGNTPAATV